MCYGNRLASSHSEAVEHLQMCVCESFDLCSDSGRDLQAELLCRNRIQKPTGPLEGCVVNRKRPRYHSLTMPVIQDLGWE